MTRWDENVLVRLDIKLVKSTDMGSRLQTPGEHRPCRKALMGMERIWSRVTVVSPAAPVKPSWMSISVKFRGISSSSLLLVLLSCRRR